MLNREKFAKELVDIAIKGGNLAVVDGKPVECDRINDCRHCYLNPSPGDGSSCRQNRQKWADSEVSDYLAPIDWSKVPIDTPVLVRDDDSDDWTKAYFAGFKNGRVCTWDNGATSWSTSIPYLVVSWRYAKLDADAPHTCRLSDEEIATFRAGIETGDLEFAFDNPDWRKIYQKIIDSDREITSVSYGLKYITKSDVLKYWDKRPIGIAFSDGTDVLAQENGYSLGECLDMEDVKFFLD